MRCACLCWRTSWPLILSQPPALPSHLPQRQFPFLPSVICRTPQEHKEQSIHRTGDQYPRKKKELEPPDSLDKPFFPSIIPTGPSPAFIPPFTNREKSRQSRPSEQEEKAPHNRDMPSFSLSLPQTLLSKVASLGRQRLRQRRRPLLAKALFLSYQTAAEADSVSPRDRADKRRGAKHSTPKCLSSLHELSSISVEEC